MKIDKTLIRLAKFNGEYFLQKQTLTTRDCNPWWKPFGNNYKHTYSEWENILTTNLPGGKNEIFE